MPFLNGPGQPTIKPLPTKHGETLYIVLWNLATVCLPTGLNMQGMNKVKDDEI